MMILPSLTASAYEMHFLVGVIIALVARKRWLIPALALGIGKEIFDFYYHGDPDLIDAAVTVGGAAVTSILLERINPYSRIFE